MRRTGVWVSVFKNSVIHEIIYGFLKPFQDFRACVTCVSIQRVAPFYRGFLFICFWKLLVGFVTLLVIGFRASNGCNRSIINIVTWHKHWRVRFSVRSSLSRVSLSLNVVVGEEDELEEDVGWSFSWLESVIDVEELELDEELVDKPGTNERIFSVLHCMRLPLLMRCIFERWSTRMSIRVHRKTFRAIRLLAYSRGLSKSRMYPILWHTQLPLHAFALLHWRLWLSYVGLHDVVKVSISALLKSFMLIMCIDAPKSTTNSLSSSVKNWCRQAPILRKWEECCSASRAPCSCHSVSSWDRSLNFGALGLRSWSSPGRIIPNEGFWSRILVWRAIAFWIGFGMSVLFRRIDFGGVMSWNTQPNCRASENWRLDEFCPNLLSLVFTGCPVRS